MPNLYGVAGTPPALQYLGLIGNVSISCPAGTETNIFATPTLTATDHGIYYPVAWGVIVLNYGATASSSLLIALRVNSGADISEQQFAIASGAANTAQTYAFAFAGPAMPTAFWAPGSVVQVSVTVGAQAATAANGYCGAVVGIQRAPDQ